LEFQNYSSSLKGSAKKEWQNSLKTAFAIDAPNKVGYFLRIGVIYLEKYPKIKSNFYLCPK